MEGESPESVETSTIQSRLKAIDEHKALTLNSTNRIKFDPAKDLVFHYFESLPQHPNGMRFCCFDDQGDLLATNEYFSIGGGFVVNERTQLAHGDNAFYKGEQDKETNSNKVIPQTRRNQDLATAALPFTNAQELLELCKRENMTIAQVVYENELRWRSAAEIREKTFAIWNTMDNAIKNGCLSSEEMLPGRLRVRRRAPGLYKKLLKGLYSTTPLYKDTQMFQGASQSGLLGANGLSQNPERGIDKVLPRRSVKRLMLPALDYLSVYAIAVNEENAAGGRVVTAPTNGAAGVIPAVLKYYLEFISDNPEQDIMEFLLTTAAIGMLYKRGASISAAEMGCQGEVGVACSMASAGFAAVMGGTVQQVENAAEIGMEHNLGLTCDPIDGLVQIPCIERNALGAVKAVTAAQLALNGDGHHRVTLDQVIETMRQTGNDMQAKYKETSQGGLSGKLISFYYAFMLFFFVGSFVCSDRFSLLCSLHVNSVRACLLSLPSIPSIVCPWKNNLSPHPLTLVLVYTTLDYVTIKNPCIVIFYFIFLIPHGHPLGCGRTNACWSDQITWITLKIIIKGLPWT